MHDDLDCSHYMKNYDAGHIPLRSVRQIPALVFLTSYAMLRTIVVVVLDEELAFPCFYFSYIFSLSLYNIFVNILSPQYISLFM